MNAQPWDAREVLERYVAALNKPDGGVIRDATELSHPKDIIRFVLQHCIKTIEGADNQDFLRGAYLSLGNFQLLSDEERKAVTLLADVGAVGSSKTGLHEEQAKRISEVATPLQGLIDRLRAEVAVLLQELECLPAPPEPAPLPQGTQLPQAAAATAPLTAGAAPVT